MYFYLEDAKQFVKECEAKDIAVIGVEGFTLDETGILLHLDLIADYTAIDADWHGYVWDQFRRQCNDATRDFLDTAAATKAVSSLVFNFVVMKPEKFGEFQREHDRVRASRAGR